jgi:hypothetical protein
VHAYTDTRTVERYLDGGPQHTTTRARIAAVLKTMGLEP